jgi:hypothetical protein
MLTSYIQTLYLINKGPSCGYPDFMKFAMMLYMFSMIGLFAHFFVHRYVKAGDVQGTAKSKLE